MKKIDYESMWLARQGPESPEEFTDDELSLIPEALSIIHKISKDGSIFEQARHYEILLSVNINEANSHLTEKEADILISAGIIPDRGHLFIFTA